MRIVLTFSFIGLLAGCTPTHYRRQADRETYHALAQRQVDARWMVPSVSIEPSPESRLFDPFVPDRPPQPPDDSAAHRYMSHWHEREVAPWIESPEWRAALLVSENDELELTTDRAVELGLLHSREYQTQLEDLYLAALALTLERFDFSLQWFGGNDTTFEHFGSGGFPTETNTLTTASNLGFRRAFSRGGQLLVEFANTFVWEFSGPNVGTTTSNIGINLVQPLLRLAGREVRLEQLTQAERNVLYAVRDFARFRRQFHVNIATGSGGYLSLLLQLQNIRNQETNVQSLEQNLELYDALDEMGTVSGIQVDQVFQSYQRGRLALRQAQANLETALDVFKITLGLPPTVNVVLDDSLLSPFELNDPRINALQDELGGFQAAYRELDEAPTLEKLNAGYRTLEGYQESLREVVGQVQQEMDRWKLKMDNAERARQGEPTRREQALAESVFHRLGELPAELAAIARNVDQAATALSDDKRKEGWETLQKLTGQYLEILAELFILQTEIRVYLIELPEVEYEPDTALQFARAHRLDLMNRQAQVTDAWRKITVAANRLQADLDIVADADIATLPGGNNPVNFSSAASSYRLGVRFDAPLNRKLESNIYRASLINYQRARRSYMQLQDEIEQAVRRDLRQLETDRLTFEIARESLVVAARQVQQTREQLLLARAPGDSSSTQDVLNALNALLEAKNALIGIWISYEVNRTQLLFDLEALQLNERGVNQDEHAAPGSRFTAETSFLVRLPPVE